MKILLAFIIILSTACQIHAQSGSRDTKIEVPLFTPGKAIDSLLQIDEIDHLKNADFVITVVNDPYNKLLKILQIQKAGAKFEYNPGPLPFPVCGYFMTNKGAVFIEGYKKNIDLFFTSTNKSKKFRFLIVPTSPAQLMETKLYNNIFIYKNGTFSYGFISAH